MIWLWPLFVLPSSSVLKDVATRSSCDAASTSINDSMSHHFSTTERYAAFLNMTVSELQERQRVHKESSNRLHVNLQDPTISGKEKHEMTCQHRYQYGRHPFVCRRCWSYDPVCMCRQAEKTKTGLHDLPPIVDSISLYTSHYEWGSVSNTGVVLPLFLKDTTLLMKGLPQHDGIFQNLLGDDNQAIPVVLWTDNAKVKKKRKNNEQNLRCSLAELKTQLNNNNKRISLIALEGTWRNARRMASKLPPHCIRVSLDPQDIIISQNSHNSDEPKKQSILAPLRRQLGADVQENNVCTAEAVISALVGLGLERHVGEEILGTVQEKIQLTRRYQGKRLRD